MNNVVAIFPAHRKDNFYWRAGYEFALCEEVCCVNLFVAFFLGGVVVFAVNSLLYLNQSVPPYGVSLNSQTAGTTAFPLRKRHHLETHTPTHVSLISALPI